MVMQISNCRAVQPFVGVVNTAVKSLPFAIPRGGFTATEDMLGYTNVILPGLVDNVEEVSVYVDGFRMLNQTFDFGKTWSAFTVQGDFLYFNEPVTGTVQIFVDKPWSYVLPDQNYISVNNVQGGKTKATNPGEVFGGTFCEPFILTLPTNGYVRLTDDRKRLVYVPNQNFVGYDAFSYSVITDRGQIADPKCVNVKVGNPSPPPSDNGGDDTGDTDTPPDDTGGE